MNELQKTENQVAVTSDDMLIRAIDANMDLEKLEKLIDLKERWDKKIAEKAYNGAMATVQKQIGAVKALKHNKQTGSKYAGIVDIDAAIRPHYTANGIAISFDTADCPTPEHVRVLAHVTHCDGHKETRHIDIPADGKGAKGGDVMTKTHAVMSATTYGQRALLKMIFNIASGEFDDDGNGATKKQPSELPWLNPKTEQWQNAVVALKGSYKIEDIKKKYRISKENEEQLKNDVLV